MKIELGKNGIIVDVCHIVPFADAQWDTNTNGALSPNLSMLMTEDRLIFIVYFNTIMDFQVESYIKVLNILVFNIKLQSFNFFLS
jgi:hypothetical protein